MLLARLDVVKAAETTWLEGLVKAGSDSYLVKDLLVTVAAFRWARGKVLSPQLFKENLRS